MIQTYSVKDHFVNKDPSVRALYDQLLSLLHTFGPATEDPKKNSIHLKGFFHGQDYSSLTKTTVRLPTRL